MAGNSQRRGATRSNPRKGPTAGSGGQGRKSLRGKGPTPKAENREKHAAAKAKRRRTTERAPGAQGHTPGAEGRTQGVGKRTTAPRRQHDSQRAPGNRRTPGNARRTNSPEMVAGRNSVIEALRTGVPATTVYVAHRVEADDRVREAVATAHQRGIPVLETPRGELDRLTDGAIHQGLALSVPAYQYAHPLDLVEAATDAGVAPLIVALDGVTDPRNLGAIVRSAAAFGGHGVVVPQRRAAGMTAAAWKTSAGAAARLPVAQATNLTRALKDLQQAGCFVVGLDGVASDQLADLSTHADPLVIVIGSEGAGLSRLVKQTCDAVVSIPMHAATESLNAGVAASIALYDIARRRGHR
ncbi:MAG: 23S rRNA (guanosine(2251)-2'-O)-methyltransferase RlmB [Actinomycetota bacterium]